MEALEYKALKERQRLERDSYHPNLALRVHRALSWLNRAEQTDDLDGRFIFLWIAFNAAYATEIEDSNRLSKQSAFVGFLNKLCELGQSGHFENTVWLQYPNAIRGLLNNPYVFKSFWDGQNGKVTEEEWQSRFDNSKRRVALALSTRDTAGVLGIVFTRLYTLRNQLIHGGATYGSIVNRGQLRDCVNLLDKLVPLMIRTMMDNPNTLWGDAVYPVVEKNQGGKYAS